VLCSKLQTKVDHNFDYGSLSTKPRAQLTPLHSFDVPHLRGRVCLPPVHAAVAPSISRSVSDCVSVPPSL
jgi:hypothetical protein